MASYDKCIKFESEKPQGMIRLVESNGFYRAYNHDSYCERKMMVAKSRLQDFGRISQDALRFYPNVLDWQLYNLNSNGRKRCAN